MSRTLSISTGRALVFVIVTPKRLWSCTVASPLCTVLSGWNTGRAGVNRSHTGLPGWRESSRIRRMAALAAASASSLLSRSARYRFHSSA